MQESTRAGLLGTVVGVVLAGAAYVLLRMMGFAAPTVNPLDLGDSPILVRGGSLALHSKKLTWT